MLFLFKFFFWTFLFYLLYRLLINIFGQKNTISSANRDGAPIVKGRTANDQRLDLTNLDVEDATYIEIKKDKKIK